MRKPSDFLRRLADLPNGCALTQHERDTLREIAFVVEQMERSVPTLVNVDARLSALAASFHPHVPPVVEADPFIPFDPTAEDPDSSPPSPPAQERL